MKKTIISLILLMISQLSVTAAPQNYTFTQKLDQISHSTVNVMSRIFFMDPFAALGLYDPIIYQDGKPMVEILSDYTVSGRCGSLDISVSGAEAKLSKGQKIILSDEIYTVNAVSQDHATLDRPLQQDLQDSLLGTPKKMNIPLIVVWLAVGAVFFTFKLGFINVRGIKQSFRLIRGDFSHNHDKGEVSHFQALSTALSGTVGLGNIASVAVAITVGGPGATFWMIVAGILGMSTKFAECTLGVKYREIENGEVHGGPMYYLKNGLAARGMKHLGNGLSKTFAVFMILSGFAGGCMFQSNQAAAQIVAVYPQSEPYKIVMGAVMAMLIAAVVFGGLKKIANVTARVVPFMTVVYVVAALTVIFINHQNILPSLGLIVDGAFNAGALKGGVIGVLILGFQRAVFSNEAGIGTSSIAHAAVKTRQPVSEGFVAMLEPFIDTVIVCTMTALVIIISGEYITTDITTSGAALTSRAFEHAISWFPYVLALVVFLFAFSTILAWAYYVQQCSAFLFGRSRWVKLISKWIFLLMAVLGSTLSLGVVIDMTDMMLLSLAFPNLIGLYIMSGEVKNDLDKYLRGVNSGKVVNYRTEKTNQLDAATNI